MKKKKKKKKKTDVHICTLYGGYENVYVAFFIHTSRKQKKKEKKKKHCQFL